MADPGTQILIILTSTEKVFDSAIGQKINIAKERGFDCYYHIIDPRNPKYLAEAQGVLKSKHWDGVAIDPTIRCLDSSTKLLEEVVNLAASQRPRPKMIFHLNLEDLLEACKRVPRINSLTGLVGFF